MLLLTLCKWQWLHQPPITPVTTDNDVVPVAVVVEAIDDNVMPKMLGNFRDAAKISKHKNDSCFFRLMEKLINIAGETSIVRSRVEMGVHSFSQTVEGNGGYCAAFG